MPARWPSWPASSWTSARAIREETHGNPFFVKQLVRHRDESGTTKVSAGLRDVIVRRVARLPGEAGRVLRVAALVGRDFDLALLEAVVDVPEDDLLDLLDAAVARRHPRRGRERAGPLLVRARARADDARARALGDAPRPPAPPHRRGDRGALRRRLDPWLVELARHFTAAGPEEAERAVAYAVRAAEQATERLAYGEAVDLLAGALAARRDGPSTSVRARLLHDLAIARWRLGDVEESRDTFDRAAEAARRAGAAERFARAALGHSGGVWARYGTGDTASAHLLEEALALLPEADSALRAQVLARLGGVLYFSSDSEARGSSLIEAAVAMAHRVGDDDALATALSAAQFSAWRPGHGGRAAWRLPTSWCRSPSASATRSAWPRR